MKIYLFDECDFVAAIDEKSAIEFYKDETGFDATEMEQKTVEEIPESTWPSRTIIFDEEDENGKITVPFDEYLKQFSESDLPLLIASTEW